MIRVVHAVVAGEVGGAERMLVDLASRPAATRAEHVVALITPSEALRRTLAAAGLQVHDRGPAREGPLPYLRTTLGARDVAWMERVVRDEAARVVHLHTFASQVVGTRAARRAGARVLRTEHSTRVYVDPSCWPFSRWSLARADACVAISEHVRTVATGRAPWAAGKMRVVPNGVDAERFAPHGEGHGQGHGRGEGKAERFTLVLVGRLEPRKGVDLAVEAVARVPEVDLDVVGDGAERARLERLARDRGAAGRVRFHGYVGDTRPLLARAHAALGSSRDEGLGIALLEAMAMQLPVVGFAVGGVREIVEDGATGWLCRAGDVEALAQAVRAAARAPAAERAARGEAARRRVQARFSVESMCEGYARVYAELASGASASSEAAP